MKHSWTVAAGTLFITVGCGGAESTAPTALHTPSEVLAQEVEGEAPSNNVIGPIAGKLDGTAFKGSLQVVKFLNEKNTVYVNVKITDVTGLPDAQAAKLKDSVVKLPLAVEPECGFPTDGSEAFCQFLTVYAAPSEPQSGAGKLSIDRTELDFSATPGTSVAVGMAVCERASNVLKKGGLLANVDAQTANDVVLLLNGMMGVADDVPADPMVDAAVDET